MNEWMNEWTIGCKKKKKNKKIKKIESIIS